MSEADVQSVDLKQKRRANLTNEGKGRKKGVPNKVTADVKAMILEALSKAGGAEYLLKQSGENPAAFMTLIGKVLPMQVTGAGGDALKVVFTMSKADSEL